MRALLAFGLALTVLLAGCAAPERSPYDRAPDSTHESSAPLETNAFLLLPVDQPRPFHLRASVASESGAPIDAWILVGDACSIGPSGPAFEGVANVTGVSNGTLARDVPGTKACLVLDNSEDAYGGASPTGAVNVTYRIDVWEA